MRGSICCLIYFVSTICTPQFLSHATDIDDALFDMSLEEILTLTVNTRKFDEAYREVPKSISLLTQKNIRTRNINSVHELAEYIPNLSYRKSFGRVQERPAARGIANIIGTPVVGFLIDGQPHSGLSQSLPLFDMEQVEVTRGSEVAYYGRSTFAGAINFVPIKPTVFESYTESGITVAQHGEIDAQILSNIKLSETFAVLFAGREYNKDDDYHNTVGDTDLGYGRETTRSAALSFSWRPTENLELYFRQAYQENDDGQLPVYLQSSAYNNYYMDTFSQYYMGELQTPEHVGYNNSDLFELGTQSDSDIQTFKANWKQEGYDLIFAYSKSDFDSVNRFDGDLYEAPIADNQQAAKITTENFELVTRIKLPNNQRLILGTSNYQLDTTSKNDIFFKSPTGSIPRFGYPEFDYIDNASIFLGYSLPIINTLEATFDLRYSKDKISYHRHSDESDYSNSNTWKTLSPKLTLQQNFGDSGTLVYASITGSQKPGGFNDDLETLDYLNDLERKRVFSFLEFNEEKLESYETGIRTEVFNKNAWLDFGLFFNHWRNLQLTQSLSYESSTGPARTATIINGGEAHTWGGEIEIGWEINEAFTLRSSLGFAKSQLNDTSTLAQLELTGDGNVDGKEIPNWPTWNGSLIIDYNKEINDELQFYALSSFTYEDERFVAEHNLATLESSEKFNLTVGIRHQNWSISLWGKQLNDDQALESASRFIDFSTFRRGFGLGLPERRQIGITFRIKS